MAELCDPACLALTELVADVVRHTRVEVTDTCPRPPPSTAVEELAEDGRDVLIADAVMDRWGWTPLPHRPGKTVWFECDVSKEFGE